MRHSKRCYRDRISELQETAIKAKKKTLQFWPIKLEGVMGEKKFNEIFL